MKRVAPMPNRSIERTLSGHQSRFMSNAMVSSYLAFLSLGEIVKAKLVGATADVYVGLDGTTGYRGPQNKLALDARMRAGYKIAESSFAKVKVGCSLQGKT